MPVEYNRRRYLFYGFSFGLLEQTITFHKSGEIRRSGEVYKISTRATKTQPSLKLGFVKFSLTRTKSIGGAIS